VARDPPELAQPKYTHLSMEHKEEFSNSTSLYFPVTYGCGQVSEKDSIAGIAHFRLVMDAVEVDVVLDPADVGLLHAIGLMFEADGIAGLIL